MLAVVGLLAAPFAALFADEALRRLGVVALKEGVHSAVVADLVVTHLEVAVLINNKTRFTTQINALNSLFAT